MTLPHPLLDPLLLSIEAATVSTWNDYPRLQDKDVEWVYEAYKDYFRAVVGGKDLAEPISTISVREHLLEAIWDVLLLREDQHADQHLVNNPAFAPAGRPIALLEEAYVSTFARLVKSARFWRKQEGPRGYLRYVEGFVSGSD